ncbi:hypothetical protein [Nonomuraea sp. SYSU D8015]|uniref:hypothetical protein n=1 Tax=Nonomuraea sp. SYSU D8015 TaxID=2593644 RepID=UPI0016613F5E|nr:hypothetical protein [Nonomuraea sp. SYSU D8015]
MIEELYAMRVEIASEEAKKLREDAGQAAAMQGIQLRDIFATNVTFAGNHLDEVPEYPFMGLVLLDEDQISGSIDDVFSEIDRRSIRRLTFIAALQPRERLILRFSRHQMPAVTLEVESSDTGWARQALAKLADEVDKGVPRWSFVWGPGERAFYTNVAASAIVGLAVGVSELASSLGANFAIGMFVFMGIWIFSMSASRLREFIFPRFEILGDGSQSTGSRRLATLTLVLLSVPIGVFVNWIS